MPIERRFPGGVVSVVKQMTSARPSKPVTSWSATVFTPVFSVTASANCHVQPPFPSAPSAFGAVTPLTMRWKRPAPSAFGLHFAVQFRVRAKTLKTPPVWTENVVVAAATGRPRPCAMR